MAGARSPARRYLKRWFGGPRNRRRSAGRTPDDVRQALAVVRRLASIAIPVVVAVLAWPAVRDVARTHAYFALRQIDVRHHGRLDADTIRTAAGLTPGTSVWDVDPPAAEARLLALPWVRSARVRRHLPDRVVIQVREYRPAAIVAVTEPAALYYVAANGRVFAPVGETDGRDLPYVTGLATADLDGRDAYGPRAVRRALAVLRLVGRSSTALGMVSEVHIDQTIGLTLLAVRPAVPIELGWGQYEVKIARLGQVLPLWAAREDEYRSVSCLVQDEVIVRTRAPLAVPGPKRAATGA